MRVVLKNNLYTDRGFFRKSPNRDTPIDFPDELAHVLPKSAVIVSGGPVVEVAVPDTSAESLRDHDPGRAAMDSEKEAQEAADKQDAVNARMAKARAARGTHTE